MNRSDLRSRPLPVYCKGEQIINTITHGIGIPMSIGITALCLHKASTQSLIIFLGCALYGICMFSVYLASTLYHGWPNGLVKRVLQVADHCAIYFLIAGTYTPVLLLRFIANAPFVGWGLLALQWLLGILACVLTAVDLHKYRVFSMVCYIFMGWAIVLCLPVTLQVLSTQAFSWLLAGGITYTIGAVLFGLGKKLRWMHTVFHLFVLAGSILQFISIYFHML